MQGPNQFQGNSITYNSKTRIVSATGSGQSGEKGSQVELIFHPQTTPKLKLERQKESAKSESTTKAPLGNEPTQDELSSQ
jgi:hypothetical protein